MQTRAKCLIDRFRYAIQRTWSYHLEINNDHKSLKTYFSKIHKRDNLVKVIKERWMLIFKKWNLDYQVISKWVKSILLINKELMRTIMPISFKLHILIVRIKNKMTEVIQLLFTMFHRFIEILIKMITR